MAGAAPRPGLSTIRLVFLGRLEDIAGMPDRIVPHVSGIDHLLDALEPDLAQALRGPRVKLAVNGTLLRENEAPILREGDEIAFLPPVSGG